MTRSRFSFDSIGVAGADFADIEYALDANESALGPSPLAIDAMARMLAESHLYPDNGSQDLRAELARRCRVAREQIVCGAGSTELIRLAAEVFVGPGQRAIAPRASFRVLGHRMAQLGRDYTEMGVDRFEPDIAQLAAAADSSVAMVYIASPGNPTGAALTLEALTALCDSVSPAAVLVIDEAYSDYSDHALADSPGMLLAGSRPNTLCLRTFSKIYGLAGLRIGWSVSSADLARRLDSARSPYNIALPAQHAALAALGDDGFIRAARLHTAQWRKRIVSHFEACGRRAFDRPTNFVLAELTSETEAVALCDHLESAGIAVKHLGDYGLGECLRITIGRDSAMEALSGHLTAFFGRGEFGILRRCP